MPSRYVNGNFESCRKLGLSLIQGLAICLVGVSSIGAQAIAPTQGSVRTSRLLTAKEGRAIVNAAWELGRPMGGIHDCSHLIHVIYQNSGFDYPYQSSLELYAGAEKFARVKFPHAGDLVVWPGHVGIVVDPKLHSFYSLVRAGLEEQDYEGPYWKSRGAPRFLRYKIDGQVLLASEKTPAPANVSNAKLSTHAGRATTGRPAEANPENLEPKTASVPGPVIYGPRTPLELREPASAFKLPSSIVISAGKKLPTRDEVAETFSELTDAEGSLLRTDDPLKAQMPVVIIQQMSVDRLEIKRDRGRAYLQIFSKASIVDGEIQLKRMNEEVVWELRRTESNWEAITPADRAYVPHDVAVKILAAQLARLTESNGAGNRREDDLRQESQLARLLNALLARE